MDKEGHLGVVKSAQKPIQPIADNSEYGDRSEGTQSPWPASKNMHHSGSTAQILKGKRQSEVDDKSHFTDGKLLSHRVAEDRSIKANISPEPIIRDPIRSSQRIRTLQAPTQGQGQVG